LDPWDSVKQGIKLMGDSAGAKVPEMSCGVHIEGGGESCVCLTYEENSGAKSSAS